MRKIVKTIDVEVLFGKQKRQANNLLRLVRAHYKKQRHQPVTIREFANFYGLSEDEVAETVLFNDN